jgi:hypothetical protein
MDCQKLCEKAKRGTRARPDQVLEKLREPLDRLSDFVARWSVPDNGNDHLRYMRKIPSELLVGRAANNRGKCLRSLVAIIFQDATGHRELNIEQRQANGGVPRVVS